MKKMKQVAYLLLYIYRGYSTVEFKPPIQQMDARKDRDSVNATFIALKYHYIDIIWYCMYHDKNWQTNAIHCHNGELWRMFYQYFEENRQTYTGTAL